LPGHDEATGFVLDASVLINFLGSGAANFTARINAAQPPIFNNL
jgi:hypothetical protein